jgi:adrenodoxin-NADP+ reductase
MPKIPLQLAVVGAGPSAFYTASRVLSRLPDAHVHLFDRLWAPHGLVRYGVAPDHPEVKASSSAVT